MFKQPNASPSEIILNCAIVNFCARLMQTSTYLKLSGLSKGERTNERKNGNERAFLSLQLYTTLHNILKMHDLNRGREILIMRI